MASEHEAYQTVHDLSERVLRLASYLNILQANLLADNIDWVASCLVVIDDLAKNLRPIVHEVQYPGAGGDAVAVGSAVGTSLHIAIVDLSWGLLTQVAAVAKPGCDLMPALLADDHIELKEEEFRGYWSEIRPFLLSEVPDHEEIKLIVAGLETERTRMLEIVALTLEVNSASPADLAEPASDSLTPKKAKRPGPPKADYETEQREAQLAAAWNRAREAGVCKADFAKEKGTTVRELDKLLDRVAKRKHPSE